MQPTLIILRGNSGSGKSTVAKALQRHFGPNTLLIDQDVVRIDMMNTKDRENNLAINLIKEIALYGHHHCETVILEGILSTSRYSSILQELIDTFQPNVHPYYFDIPFEETVRRHATRDKRHKFGEEDMRRWWKEKDLLSHPNERIIKEQETLEEIVSSIVEQVSRAKHPVT